MASERIGDVVIKHVGMPGFNLAAAALRYTDPKDPARQLEKAVHHAVHREERPQLLLIEVIMGPPEPLRAVAELPGRKARRGPSRFARLRLLQLAALALERVRTPASEVIDESQGPVTRLRHSPRKDKIREMRLPKEARPLGPELEDPGNERRVVVRRRGADRGGGTPRLASERVVLEIRHERLVGGHVERETPRRAVRARQPLRDRLRERAGLGMGGKARKAGLVLHDELPGVGGVEDILRITLGHLRELGLDGLQAGAALGGKVGARLAEFREGFGHEALPHGREALRSARARERLEPVPERGSQRDARRKGRHLGQGPVVGLAQLGGIRHRLEVCHPAPGAVQRVGRLVKRQEGPLERRLPDGRLDRVEGRFRPGDRLVDRRLDEFGRQRAPADVERRV